MFWGIFEGWIEKVLGVGAGERGGREEVGWIGRRGFWSVF